MDYFTCRSSPWVISFSVLPGVYSRLEACFILQRAYGFFFIQLLVPATALVIMSWLPLRMVSETSLGELVEIILAITFLYYSYNSVMPKVSYVKAMYGHSKNFPLLVTDDFCRLSCHFQ